MHSGRVLFPKAWDEDLRAVSGMGMMKGFNRWAAGGVASTLVVWGLSAVFFSGISTYAWDDLLGRYMYAPGQVRRWRSEGWADTHVGRHQFIVGEDNIAESGLPKVVIWGDSHVEALQVPNEYKISSLFNTLSRGEPCWAVSVGGGGRGIGDIFHDIKSYSEVFENIRGNVIVLNGMEDVLPGNASGLFCDPLRIRKVVDGAPSWKSLRYGPTFAKLRLAWLYDVYRRSKEHIASWFVSVPDGAWLSKKQDCSSVQIWDYFLQSLQEQHEGFWVFVYCPKAPVLVEGRIVCEDPDSEQKIMFKERCEEYGIAFLDVGEGFNRLYRDKNEFPRGFFNLPPGLGHMNKYGLEVIAKELYDYISSSYK